MENPRYHKQWQAAVDEARADPTKKERVEAVIKQAEQQQAKDIATRRCGSSLLSKIYHALAHEGLITP